MAWGLGDKYQIKYKKASLINFKTPRHRHARSSLMTTSF